MEDDLIQSLIDTGYYRALTQGVPLFDKVLGCFAWCIISISLHQKHFDIDSLLSNYTYNSPLGHKIQLSEIVVQCLQDLKAPSLEPHQIQGLDIPRLVEVFRFLALKLQFDEFKKQRALEYFVQSKDDANDAEIPLLIEKDALEHQLISLRQNDKDSQQLLQKVGEQQEIRYQNDAAQCESFQLQCKQEMKAIKMKIKRYQMLVEKNEGPEFQYIDSLENELKQQTDQLVELQAWHESQTLLKDSHPTIQEQDAFVRRLLQLYNQLNESTLQLKNKYLLQNGVQNIARLLEREISILQYASESVRGKLERFNQDKVLTSLYDHLSASQQSLVRITTKLADERQLMHEAEAKCKELLLLRTEINTMAQYLQSMVENDGK